MIDHNRSPLLPEEDAIDDPDEDDDIDPTIPGDLWFACTSAREELPKGHRILPARCAGR